MGIRPIEDAAYGCPARKAFLDVCKRSVSTPMRQDAFAEGEQDAESDHDSFRHKVTAKSSPHTFRS
jgi:hypothetical protein